MLAGLVGLGGLLAVGESSVLLLLSPLWRLVLFPGRDAAAGDGGGQELIGPGGMSVGKSSDWLEAPFLWVRDRFAEGPDPELDPRGRFAVLLAIIGVLLVMALAAAVAQYAFTWLSRWVSYRMVVDLRMRLAKHLMGLSMRYHRERQFGDLLSRISADVNTLLTMVNTALKDFLLEPLSILAKLAVAAVAAPMATLGVLLALPLLALPVSILSRKVRKRSTSSLTSLGASVQALAQMFHGMRTVKAFRAEERELKRYRDLNEHYLRTSMRMIRAIALTHTSTLLFGLLGIAALFLLISWLNIRFELFSDPDRLAVFVLAIAQVNHHVKRTAKALTRVQESVGASDRLGALLDETPDVVEVPSPRRIQAFREMLRFRDVTFRYGEDERPAISGLTLEVRRGEKLALVGPSGAGKSTLLDLVCRFIDPTDGALLVDGHDLRELSLDDWSRMYARVDQQPFLFHTTIAENIRYGRPDATQAEVEDAARAANIHEFIVGLPAGYDTNVADAGARLSGGQVQRIAIARALLKSAPILLLDEATSALDSESETLVQEALEHLMRDRTVIVIAHRLATIRDADRIACLEGGRLVEIGTHDALLRRGGTYARLHALQQLEVPARS